MVNGIRHPSTALVISAIVLFAALSGAVYAAATISGKSIKVKSLPGNRVKPGSLPGNRLKPGSVTGTQVDAATLGQVPSAATANSANSAQNATNASALDGHTAGCAAGTITFAGACWEASPRPPLDAPAAAQACTAAGGELPEALALRSFALSSGVTLDAGDEWSGTINTVTAENAYTMVTVSPTGTINLDNQTDTKKFRCVLPLVH